MTTLTATVREPRRTTEPTSERYILVRRGCRLTRPYTAGFEDFRYNRIYSNPFHNDTPEFLDYDRGHTDARRNQEKI